MNHDPKLKEAMTKIEDLMKEYDIGGYVSLVSPTHSEFMLHIDPMWSCAFFEEPGKVRFKATEKDYGSKEARDRAMELTVHMILQIRDLGAQAFMFGEELEKLLKTKMEIEHKPFSKK